MEILISPDPRLLLKSEPCIVDDKSLKPLINEMLNIMYKYDGCGLAAPQLGVNKRLIVVDCFYDPTDEDSEKNPIVLYNPKIIDEIGEAIEAEEGCLSCPGVKAHVMRYPQVKVEYSDGKGDKQVIEGEGLLSCCLQHEIDHLEGKTLFQTSNPSEKIELYRHYQEALEQGARPGTVVNFD